MPLAVPLGRLSESQGRRQLHVLLSHEDYLPEYLLITKARQADVRLARHFKLSPGSIVVLDRGYIDFNLLADWSRAGIFWVTRTKTNLEFIAMEGHDLPQNRNILADQIVHRTVEIASYQRFPVPLRRVVVWDQANQRPISLSSAHPREPSAGAPQAQIIRNRVATCGAENGGRTRDIHFGKAIRVFFD